MNPHVQKLVKEDKFPGGFHVNFKKQIIYL
jgi:hypothetical protein